MKRTFLLVLAIANVITTTGQAIDSLHNTLRAGDSFVQYRLSGSLQLEGGYNKVWDLSSHEIGENRRITIKANVDSTNSYVINDRMTAYYFRQNKDSLLYDGYESNLAKMEFQHGIPLMVLPMHYGDSIRQCLLGAGSYSDDWLMESVGYSVSKVDAKGTLITPETDTLRNVSRIHITRISHDNLMARCDESCHKAGALASTTMSEEDYLWYAAGYRYPILHVSTSVAAGDSTGIVWYTPPYELENLAMDDANLSVRSSNSDGAFSDDSIHNRSSEILSYSIHKSPGDGRVTVTYDMTADGTVSFILSDVRGTVYTSFSQSHGTGSGYTADIRLNGLRTGVYVLYICVNNQRYVEKITVE